MDESARPTTDAATQAREAVSETTQRAADQARQAKSTVQTRARREVDTRSTRVGEQMDAASRAIRNLGSEFRSQGSNLPAQLTDEAADRVERLGRYLREADTERMVDDVEEFARRRPWLLAAAGAVVGLAAARFLKASGQRRQTPRLPATRTSMPGAGGPVTTGPMTTGPATGGRATVGSGTIE